MMRRKSSTWLEIGHGESVVHGEKINGTRRLDLDAKERWRDSLYSAALTSRIKKANIYNSTKDDVPTNINISVLI